MSRCMTIASSIVSPMQTPATSTDSAKFLVELLAPAVMNFEVQSPEQKARSALEYALKNTTSLHGFILRGVIGFGSNGVVLAAEQMTSENTSFPVAIKCIYKASSKRSSLTKTPPKEILTLRAIARDPHPSLLHYISDYQDHQNFYVITELYGIDWLARAASIHEVASCTLSPLVVKETGILLPFSSGSSDLWAWSYYERSVNWDCETGRTHLPFCLIKKILKDLCCAVAHMHEIGLFHGDIKAENVLVSATFESEGRTDGFNRYGDVSIRLCDFGHSDFTDARREKVDLLTA
ncbi:kinase-like domain-containing protein [Chytriomyces sp. MP71]|nr:kinase-like domain-containing protein [Chytriomyces sp. MP71]